MMSVKVMERVWDHSLATGPAFVVLVTLADFANDNSVAFPSVETLAKKSRQSIRTVQRALHSLSHELQELRVDKGAAAHGCNRYTVLLDDPDTLGRPSIWRRQTPASTGTPPATGDTPATADIPPATSGTRGVPPVAQSGANGVTRSVKIRHGNQESPPEGGSLGSRAQAGKEKWRPPATKAEIEAALETEADPQKRRLLHRQLTDLER